jgi:glycosyltransferase involved in cell wall biosynthesis
LSGINEENNLTACLESLQFVDEIVVVLDRCTDESKHIAEKYTSHILEGAWEREGPRRNTGIEACASDWTLEVDADERVPPLLAEEIRTVIEDTDTGYFQIPFHNYIGKTLVKNGWGASLGVRSKACLFSKNSKRWGDQRVHPKITLPQYRGRLNNAFIHYVDKDISDMIKRLDSYTTAMAIDLRESGSIGTFIHNLRRIPVRFFKCYIMRKGFKEGHYGFLIALFASLMPMLAYIKARLENH